MSPKDNGSFTIHLEDSALKDAARSEQAEVDARNQIDMEKYMASIGLTKRDDGNWLIEMNPWEALDKKVIHEQTAVQDLRTVAHWLKNYPAESYGVYGNVTSAQDLIGLLDAVWEELRHLQPDSFISREDRNKAIHNVRMARDSEYMTGVILNNVGDSEVVSEVEKIIKNVLDPHSLTKNDVMLMISKVRKAREDEKKRIDELGMF